MKTIIICTITILFMITGSVQSQQFENVLVNHITEGRQNMWGGNALAVYDNNVYIVWQETEHTYASFVSKSTDGGATFQDGVQIDGDHPQFFAVLTVDDAGAVYVAWTGVDEATQMPNGVLFAKSTDEGATFPEPDTLSATGAFPQVAVYNDHVYVFYLNIMGEGEFGFFLTRSVDGGTTFQPPVEVTDVPIASARFEDMNDMFVDDNGVIYCVWNDGRKGTGSDIYFALSTDNGQTFGENIPVHAVIDGDEKERFGASIAVYGSHVYIAWREEDGENENILFTKSTDGGASFEIEKTIVENSLRSPSVAVNSQGDIYIVYPHFDPYPNYPEDYRQGVFITASNNQGDTFPVQLFISDQNSNAKDPSTYVDANDVLHILWADERAGHSDIYFARGTIPMDGTAAPFALIGPPDGTHFILTDPEFMFRLEWEDVLELGDNDDHFDDNTSVYYHFRAALDAEFESGLGYDYFLRPYEEVRAGELGYIFALLQYHTGEVPDNVSIYWTIGAVNEWGTTWSGDTLHMSFEIDNNPPSDAVQLLEPADGTVIEVEVSDGTYTPVGGDITFSWNPTTDPDGDIVYYHWMMSNQYPLPDIYDDEFGERNDEDYLIYIFPSGEFDVDAEWDQGGVDTYLTIPPDIVFHWFLWGQTEERTFYWTVIASDRFGMYHWVPGADTLQVSFRSTFTSVTELDTGVPSEFYLAQNYPNPFNPETTIRFALPVISDVRLDIFNLIGQRITTLIDGEQYGAGTYEVVWNGRDSSGREVPSGIYIYSITTGEHSSKRNMILLK